MAAANGNLAGVRASESATRGTWWRGAGIAAAAMLLLALAAGCARDEGAGAEGTAGKAPRPRDGSVTISGDDSIAESLTWRAPQAEVADDGLEDARRRADAALAGDDLHEGVDSAIPLYLAILARAGDDKAATAGLGRAVDRLLEQGRGHLATADDDIEALRRARVVAAVARSVRPADEAVLAFLQQVDLADRLWEVNRAAEEELRAGRLGEDGGGALEKVREALALREGQPRAMQTLAAIESALIRRAEDAAAAGDFAEADRWLGEAAGLAEGRPTIVDARARIARARVARIARLRDDGIAALPGPNGIETAREMLAQMLALARPGDPAVAELRERIDLAVHYGLFRPGQRFTDAAGSGARGPRMVVVPHGGFTMGAVDGDDAADDNERPSRQVRFDRGFALAVHEVTVAEYRRFVEATGYRSRADRRGFSMSYEERSGNFVRRSGVDWRSGYAGDTAADDMPVLHVSARDAQAYADWLAAETGERYRLPSEAEFEYALRAGGRGVFPWGAGDPPAGAGNFTGSGDRSPGGRSWSNAFDGYDDGFWGPAPVGRFSANAFGLHDLAGNVSEWVADCWHAGYRRAPRDGVAWVNPGCRVQVIRGGAWASAPGQTRSSWRAPGPVDTTNARIGFRVARDL